MTRVTGQFDPSSRAARILLATRGCSFPRPPGWWSILVITGVVLSSVYRVASERAFDRRLNLYLRTLIAEVATPDDPPDHQFQSLGEPLFDLPLSGWYWQIARTDPDKEEVRASRSLWDKKLPKLEELGA